MWGRRQGERGRKTERDIWSVRQRCCRCICPVGVCLQLLTPLSTQSLGLVCVNFCVWLWARGMIVHVKRCVPRLTVWKLIYTVSALTSVLCVCMCVWDLCLHARLLYTALLSQLLQVMSLVLRVQLSWALAFNFSDAGMPVNLRVTSLMSVSSGQQAPLCVRFFFLTSPPKCLSNEFSDRNGT